MLKKLINICLSLALTFGVIGFNNFFQEVKAYDYTYPMSCGGYEVDVVNRDGSFSQQACYGDFNSAKSKMYELGRDAVVRHASSKSPSKIIAMVSGTAYSYGYRFGKNTLNITQTNNNTPNQKKTYVTMHREMHYLGTESYDGNGNGSVHINLTGFDGYTELAGVDLIPTIFTEAEIPIMLGGQGTGQYTEQPFLTHIYQMEYVIEQNGNYRDLVFYWYSGWSGPSTYPTKNRHVLGPAADWMVTGSKYYSYDGYTFYSDKYYKDYVGTYYNYYQFLPLRTKSNISADTFNRYIGHKGYSGQSVMEGMGQVFVDGQNTYGINALLTFAMGCLESGYGTSDIAKYHKNLFGWNAFDSSPGSATVFESVDQGIIEHMGINLRGFVDINDSRFFGTHLGNKGAGINLKYAADPYWGYKIASIAYDIDKFANGYNGRLTDCNQYALGVINTYGIDIKARPSSSSATLYNSRYGATYQKAFTVTLLSEENGFYKTNTTNALNGTSVISGRDKGLVPYDYNNHVGYIPKNYVDRLNSATINQQVGNIPTGEFVFSVDSFGWNGDKLAISGKAYRPGIYATDENKISHSVSVYNQYFETTSFNLNSNVNNDIATYSGDIDVSSLSEGTYKFEINTAYAKYTEFNQTRNVSKDVKLPEEKIVNDKKINFVVENDYFKMVVTKYVAPAPKPEVTPTPQPDIIQTINMLLNKFEYQPDSNIIDIEGIAFINGIEANGPEDIKHQLVVVNSETKEEVKVIDLTTTKKDPINMGDGLEYSNVYFSGSLNVEELVGESNEDYHLLLKITCNDVVEKTSIRNTFLKSLPEVKTINDKQVRITNSSILDYRYDFMITNSKLDYSIINKPSKRDSLFSISNITLNEDGTMDLGGLAVIYYTDFNDASKINYSLELVNDTSGEVVSIEGIKSMACEVDYQALLGLSFATKDACINHKVDLNNLSDGKYVVNAKIVNGDYVDVFEVVKTSGKAINQTVVVNDKTITITSDTMHKRLEVTVTTEVKNVEDPKQEEAVTQESTAQPTETTQPVETAAALVEPVVKE